MPRPFRFECNGCRRHFKDKECYQYCLRCKKDFQHIDSLFTLIRRARPKNKDHSLPQVLARLWLAFTRDYHDAQPEVIADAEAFVAKLKTAEQLELFR